MGKARLAIIMRASTEDQLFFAFRDEEKCDEHKITELSFVGYPMLSILRCGDTF
jgi:hypothetical protein